MGTRKRAAVRPGTRPTAPAPAAVRFFRTPSAWRAWLAAHHAVTSGLWVGFWRVSTGRPSITWPQSVDEALCFGWIDGLRRGLDTERYAIRFSPRSAKSLWSRVNLRRFAELAEAGQVRAAGHAARGRWDDRRSSGYSHESPRSRLGARSLAGLRANARAWRFWNAQSPSYRRMAGNWVAGAKREETRVRRLATLVDCCTRGRAIPPVAKWMKVRPAPR